MQEQAGNLAELVSRFKLNGDQQQSVAMHQPRAAVKPAPRRVALSR
jgi:hypothetical protein